jgi:hypothetical protein
LFDIGAPIALYYVLHGAGMPNLWALTISAVVPVVLNQPVHQAITRTLLLIQDFSCRKSPHRRQSPNVPAGGAFIGLARSLASGCWLLPAVERSRVGDQVAVTVPADRYKSRTPAV